MRCASAPVKLLRRLDCLIVQDIYLTDTAQLADVVLPGSASWCEANGTVTNSERRVQLVRKALDPPGDARDDNWIIGALAKRLGYDWGDPTAEQAWDELRGSLTPMHAGMSYTRLEEHGGLQWPCFDEQDPGAQFLHGRLWGAEPVQGPRAAFHPSENRAPIDVLDDEFPLRLTTGRRLDDFNTGVQSNGYASPLRKGETLDLSPQDAAHWGVDRWRARSDPVPTRRGRGAGSLRPAAQARPRVHDVSLPR